MVSRPFIARPILAWVIAIGIMLTGLGAIYILPIEQYPDIAPTQVNIRARYPGASAETLESSVTQIIEQQLTGLTGLLYFSASSSSDGQVAISATFNKDIDPDIAQVQVQNKVQQALSRLPQEVQEQGVTVTKANDDTLLLLAIYDETDRQTDIDVADYLVSNLQDVIGRLPGVDSINVFGSQYAMRIWLDPFRLAAYGLMPSDVINAIEAQNTQVAAGQIGSRPSPRTQMLNATVTARSRLTTPAQFEDIILKTETDGSRVVLSDVARVELGSEAYTTISRYDGHPAAGIAVQLAPGADALATADRIKETVARQARSFPHGFRYAFPRDSTTFIRLSVSAVVRTLIEAIVLVVIVMFVFLQSWRATLIPAIAVPVVLLGTFGVLALFGYSINTLTLFGLVLSIGLLVDDAIVVVENVERVMEEDPDISPRDATLASMAEIQPALIGIALVLSAVFLPMAFFGGSIGVIYRQFSITIISSMILSVLVALILTPALTATVLQRSDPDVVRQPQNGRIARIAARLRTGFNNRFERTRTRYVAGTETVLRRPGISMLCYAGIVALLLVVFQQLPKGFLPIEDQGQATFEYTLPSGATATRTLEVARAVEQYFLGPEGANVAGVFTVTGSRSGGAGQNVGQGFLQLAPWEAREGAERSATAITERATEQLSVLRDADVVVRTPPPVQGFSQSAGFTMQFQNAGGLDRNTFKARLDQLLTAAKADPLLASVRLRNLEDVTTLQVAVDQAKVGALGIRQADVDETLSAAWGGVYVNDFVDRGRVKRVYVQGDAAHRAAPEDLRNWHVRTASGQMAPFASFASTTWSQAPATLTRFNGLPSFAIQGQPAPGRSSGEAMERMIELAQQVPETSVDWSGLSYQERLSAGQAPLLYMLSVLVVFLCLAGLYESWSIPFSVLLVIPLGLMGAVAAVGLRGLENDVYFQVGLLTTIGLSAKNAILIVEFAAQAEKAGSSVRAAAIQAARLRLRPILMTSIAFIFGSLPLALATGPGAQSRLAIGTSVIGGMFTATVLAIFFVPLFFVIVRTLSGSARARRSNGSAEIGIAQVR